MPKSKRPLSDIANIFSSKKLLVSTTPNSTDVVVTPPISPISVIRKNSYCVSKESENSHQIILNSDIKVTIDEVFVSKLPKYKTKLKVVKDFPETVKLDILNILYSYFIRCTKGEAMPAEEGEKILEHIKIGARIADNKFFDSVFSHELKSLSANLFNDIFCFFADCKNHIVDFEVSLSASYLDDQTIDLVAANSFLDHCISSDYS